MNNFTLSIYAWTEKLKFISENIQIYEICFITPV